MLAFPLTVASSSGARSQQKSIASRSSTQALRFFLQGTPTSGFPFSSSVPLPDFPERASVLDSLFDSFTRIPGGCASHQSRRRSGSRPRTRQPLWWNDACHHALVARNGSWRDFRRSGSPEDQARFHLLRQQFHSTVRSSRTRFWNEWLGSVTSLSRRARRLACSLIRRTLSLVVTPDPCHMQWHGALALPSILMRLVPIGAPIFLPGWGLSFFQRFCPLSFSPLRVSHVLARIWQI